MKRNKKIIFLGLLAIVSLICLLTFVNIKPSNTYHDDKDVISIVNDNYMKFEVKKLSNTTSAYSSNIDSSLGAKYEISAIITPSSYVDNEVEWNFSLKDGSSLSTLDITESGIFNDIYSVNYLISEDTQTLSFYIFSRQNSQLLITANLKNHKDVSAVCTIDFYKTVDTFSSFIISSMISPNYTYEISDRADEIDISLYDDITNTFIESIDFMDDINSIDLINGTLDTEVKNVNYTITLSQQYYELLASGNSAINDFIDKELLEYDLIMTYNDYYSIFDYLLNALPVNFNSNDEDYIEKVESFVNALCVDLSSFSNGYYFDFNINWDIYYEGTKVLTQIKTYSLVFLNLTSSATINLSNYSFNV